MPRIFKSLDDVQPIKNNGTDHLGSGSFSKVNLVCHKSDPSKYYAMKEVSKKNEQELKMIVKEITLHMSLEHQNIIKFEDYFETQDKVYIFLEYAKEGDLFGYIKRKNPNEQQMLKFFYQTCVAIEYIHSKNIMHRDLKPENILLDADLNVKVCDFGWSAEYLESVNRETLCGTYEYMAPEIFFRNKQTKKTDIWALGILLYELYHGYAPFRGSRMDAVMQAIMQNTIAFKKNLAPDVKDVIMKILMFDPKKRLAIEEILSHDLITNFIKSKSTKSPEKENYHLKPRYMHTDGKMNKKRPDMFSGNFLTSRTNDTDTKSNSQPTSVVNNVLNNLRTHINPKPLRPHDVSLFLKKKSKGDNLGSFKEYASVDRGPVETKNQSSRFNPHINRTMPNAPVSSLYTQRYVGVNSSFSTNQPSNAKFISHQSVNLPTEPFGAINNQVAMGKQDPKDLKYTRVYNTSSTNVKYNFVKQKPMKGSNASFTNYFNVQTK